MQRTPAGALLGSELGLRRPVPRVHGAVVVTILNRVLAAALQDGALDFLRGRTVCVRVSDMRQAFCITLEGSGQTA